ncbi:MAG TPA: hypothetical protein PLD88_06685, partial [Candidatus Berkiella sp.]|nr:hypothetical protein [Candidatus Berkiella sp.]
MKQLKIAIFLALLIPILIVLNVNASRKVEASIKKTEFQLEDAAIDAMITVKAKALFIQEPTLSA